MISRICNWIVSYPVEGCGVAVETAGVGDTDDVVVAQCEVDGGAVVTNHLQCHRVEGSLGGDSSEVSMGLTVHVTRNSGVMKAWSWRGKTVLSLLRFYEKDQWPQCVEGSLSLAGGNSVVSVGLTDAETQDNDALLKK